MRSIEYLRSTRFGSHDIAAYLPQSGFSAGRRCMRHLMGDGVQAIEKGPNKRKKPSEHRMFSCLLKNLPITRLNQLWYSDITYIPVKNVSCIWWRSWIGRRTKCRPGGSQIRWMSASVLRRWKSHRQIWQVRDQEHVSGMPIYRLWLDHDTDQDRYQNLNG